MNSDVIDNFEKRVFFHGTFPEAAEAIVRNGFRVWFDDEESGRYASGGVLGTGIYISSNWRTALWFGPVLLRVTIRPGTRLLNAALRPDRKILAYLQKEFGREILTQPPWKVIPGNKKLKLRELITLFRYHYWNTWEKTYGTDSDGFSRWPKRRASHSHLLECFRTLLIRYGFDGYGNPDDANGIVVFADDLLVAEEIVVQISPNRYIKLQETDFSKFRTLEDLRQFLRLSTYAAAEMTR